MNKILLVSSGLKHAQDFVEPFLKRLEVYLSSQDDTVIDVRNTETFDERTFFEYNQVVFLTTIALGSLPSSTLEIFQKLENQPKNNTEVYAVIACDEYETEKCDLSKKMIERWCQRENLVFKGSLHIGSAFFVMTTASKYVVSNNIKKFAHAIGKHQNIHLSVSMLTDKLFMKTANKYWDKEIRKKQKEKKK